MNELGDLLGAAFDFIADAGGGAELTCDGVTVTCIPAAQPTRRELRETGYWKKGTVVAELTRANFELLQLTDRKFVEYHGKRRKVALIDDDDPTDPLVRVTLELAT